MSHQQNITRIKATSNALGALAKDVVFVGGATVSLYTDRPADEVRPTDDVDVLIELTNYNEYSLLDEKLRSMGFENDIESAVICRYRIQGIVVDIMPTNEKILGFSNRWYPEAFKNSIQKDLLNDCTVNIFDAAHFIATKFEAFKGRGKSDGRTSSDFEDIVYILNNRTVIWADIFNAPPELQSYLKDELGRIAASDLLDEWISCHLSHSEQARVRGIVGNIHLFIG